MQRPRIDTGSPGPWWGKKEQTESVNVPLMTGTEVSHNSGILASEGNPVSCVQTGGNGKMFPSLELDFERRSQRCGLFRYPRSRKIPSFNIYHSSKFTMFALFFLEKFKFTRVLHSFPLKRTSS